jgi:putative CocE/NonD family hydrolase
MIPMRDGVKLYTAVYMPKDKPGDHPILMQRSPYSSRPYGPDQYRTRFGGSPKMVEAGFGFAYQDVRGKFMSEGEFRNVRPQMREYRDKHDIDESTDTYDTVDFLVNNVPNNNGNVGLWGISYPGGYAALGAINSHPNLKAASPQAPTANWFVGDDFHHNGAFFLQDGVNFFGGGFGAPRPEPAPTSGPGVGLNFGGDAYQFFLKEGPLSAITEKYMGNRHRFWMDMMNHPNYDSYWQNRDIASNMVGVGCAVLNVGGVFDAEDFWGPPNVYRSTEKLNPGGDNFLCLGPWFHGMWAGRGSGQFFGGQDFGSNTSQYFQDEVEWPFFRHYLLDEGPAYTKEAHVFDSGANTWSTFDAWPPKSVEKTRISLAANGRAFIGENGGTAGSVQYTSDPDNPVPYQGGKLNRRTREYMLDDQRFATKRSDVISFQTRQLNEPITIAGPIQADLKVTMTAEDADFIVKVIDVFPPGAKGPKGEDYSGYQMLVRAEVMRGKFRNSLSNPQPFTPGKVTTVNYEMPDVFHTFKKGHRMIVQVQSTWFPLVNRNTGKFQSQYWAKKEDFVKNTINVLFGKGQSSGIEFGRVRT